MSGQVILLAEDRDDDAELAILALRRAGLSNPVVRARDGVEVLDYLLPSGASGANSLPALLFLDLRMPRVDGFETLKAIRANDRVRDLPVIILACSDEEKRRLGAMGDPATIIVRKPIDRDQLAAATGKLNLGWLMQAK